MSRIKNAFANGKNYSFVRYSMIDIYDRHLIDSLRVISEKKQQTLKKTNYQISWLDAAVLMTIIGIGFDLIESIVYAIGASVPDVLVRGICIPHAGYGFLAGYFYGKGLKSENPAAKWIGLVLVWLMHGLYDFSLSKEFLALNDNLAIIPFALAVLEIVLVIGLIRFVRKMKSG